MVHRPLASLTASLGLEIDKSPLWYLCCPLRLARQRLGPSAPLPAGRVLAPSFRLNSAGLEEEEEVLQERVRAWPSCCPAKVGEAGKRVEKTTEEMGKGGTELW